MSYYRDQLEIWLKQLHIKAKSVIDIGGAANPVSKRVASWDVENYVILDNGLEEMKQKPDIFKDINQRINPGVQYDVAFCLEVFEYVWNPVVAMQNVYDFVKRGGYAFISFPTIYPFHQPEEFDCLRYMKPGIEKLLDHAGFERWNITPRRATAGHEYLASFYQSEGMHPVRGSQQVYDIGYMIEAFK